MKRKKTVYTVCIAILVLLMIGVVTLFVIQTAQSGWVIDSSNAAQAGLIFVGLLLSLIKLLTQSGGGRSLKFYESAFKKEIGSAFSRPEQKKSKKTLLKAIALYNDDKLTGAISRLTSLKKECSSKDDFKAVLLFLALSYSDVNINDAISTYEELLKYDPSHSTAWSNLGLLYKKQGKHNMSLECYQNAVTHDDSNAYAWNNLAQAYLSMSEWEKVIAPAERSLAIKSDMYQAETALTVAYYALNDKEKSKTYFNRAVMHGGNADAISSFLANMAKGNDVFGECED